MRSVAVGRKEWPRGRCYRVVGRGRQHGMQRLGTSGFNYLHIARLAAELSLSCFLFYYLLLIFFFILFHHFYQYSLNYPHHFSSHATGFLSCPFYFPHTNYSVLSIALFPSHALFHISFHSPVISLSHVFQYFFISFFTIINVC